MVTVEIYKHDRNEIVIGDFHDPKTGNPVSAVLMAPDRVYLYSDKWANKHAIAYVPVSKDYITAILEIVAAYTDSDTYCTLHGIPFYYRG